MMPAFEKKHEDFPNTKPTSYWTNSSTTESSASSAAQPGSRRSTRYLDGLRGLAALIVFFHHYCYGFTDGQHEYGFGQDGHYHFVSLPFVRILWNGGNASVVIFFVLSGYVLSLGHLHKLQRGDVWGCRRSLLSAAVRRPIRLYLPPLVISGIYALSWHLPGPIVLPNPWSPPRDNVVAEMVFFVKTNWQFFNPFRRHDSDLFWYPYNTVMWTIPIELKGSMLVFVVLTALTWLSAREKSKQTTLTVLLFFTAAATILQLCWGWSYASSLFGIMLATLDVWQLDQACLQRVPHSARKQILYGSLFLGWYLLCQPARAGDISYSSRTPGWAWLTALIPARYPTSRYHRFWQSWGALFLSYPILRLERIQKILSCRPLRFLGRVSFMLYLVHLPLFWVMGGRVHNLFGGPRTHEVCAGGFWDRTLAVPDIGPVGLSLRFLICMAITLPFTLLISHYAMCIDNAAIKLSKRVAVIFGFDSAPRKGKAVLQDPVLPVARRKPFGCSRSPLVHLYDV